MSLKPEFPCGTTDFFYLDPTGTGKCVTHSRKTVTPTLVWGGMQSFKESLWSEHFLTLKNVLYKWRQIVYNLNRLRFTLVFVYNIEEFEGGYWIFFAFWQTCTCTFLVPSQRIGILSITIVRTQRIHNKRRSVLRGLCEYMIHILCMFNPMLYK